MIAGIPSDVSYGLECATETFDITYDVLAYYHHFNETPLAPLVDDFTYRGNTHGEYLRSLSRLYYTLYNDWFWTKAKNVERVMSVSKAAEGFSRTSAEYIDHLLKKFISSSIANDKDPASRKVQQDWLDADRSMTHSSKIVAQLARKVKGVTSDDVLHAIRRPQDFQQYLPPPVHIERFIDDNGAPAVRIGNKAKTDLAKQKKQERTVMKRSSSFLSRLIGPKHVSMFISGEAIRIEGNRFVFSVAKNNILSSSWQALCIFVLDKETDERLFNLCWYVDQTPAMDQLSALIMAVRAGDEDEIISVGNLLKINHDALQKNEYLLNLVPEQRRLNPLSFLPTNNSHATPDLFLGQTKGTNEYYRSHPEVYRAFHRRCTNRLLRNHFPEELQSYFFVDRPETVRPFRDGRVGSEILNEGTMIPQLPTGNEIMRSLVA